MGYSERSTVVPANAPARRAGVKGVGPLEGEAIAACEKGVSILWKILEFAWAWSAYDGARLARACSRDVPYNQSHDSPKYLILNTRRPPNHVGGSVVV